MNSEFSIVDQMIQRTTNNSPHRNGMTKGISESTTTVQVAESQVSKPLSKIRDDNSKYNKLANDKNYVMENLEVSEKEDEKELYENVEEAINKQDKEIERKRSICLNNSIVNRKRNKLNLNVKRELRADEIDLSNLNKKQRWCIVDSEITNSQKNCNESVNEANESSSKKELGFFCFECGAIASKEETAKRHKIAHEQGFKCFFCPQAFFMNHTAVTHQNLHRGGNLKHVDDFSQCKLCGGSFISLLYLEFHIFESHGEDILKNDKVVHLGPSCLDDTEVRPEEEETRKRFCCGTCGEAFMYSLNLECHMAFHTESIYSCGLCNSSFSLFDSLLMHVRLHDDHHSDTLLRKYIEDTTLANLDQNLAIMKNDLQRKDERVTQQNEPGENNQLITEIPPNSLDIASHNKKFIFSSQASQCKESSTHYNKDVGGIGYMIGRLRKDLFINPYLFHFLPGGKCADELEKWLF